MRSFYAKQNDIVFCGGWLSVLAWARGVVKKDPASVQLLSARGGEKFAKIIAEVSDDGESVIREGRVISIKALCGK